MKRPEDRLIEKYKNQDVEAKIFAEKARLVQLRQKEAICLHPKGISKMRKQAFKICRRIGRLEEILEKN